MCKAHCPGTGLDMDWRNRTDTCLTWKVAFSIYERFLQQKGETPLSLSPDLKKWEEVLLYGFSKGVELRYKHIKEYLYGDFDLDGFIGSQRYFMEKGQPIPHANHTDETNQYEKEFKEKYGVYFNI